MSTINASTRADLPRRWRDLLVLLLVCIPTYFFGLTDHGLTNWQESQRALVARDMWDRGDWLVPTVDGQPYLAKPPLIYWAQLTSAMVRGGPSQPPTEFDLRFVVALAATLGVLATYLAARSFLDDGWPRAPAVVRLGNARFARDAAFLGSLFLATGMLYVRSGRIGELDILLVPFVVTAVGAIAKAWRIYRDRGEPAGTFRSVLTGMSWVFLATAAAVGAALVKGPPGILVIGAAAYGAMALHAGQRADYPPVPRSRNIAGAVIGGVVIGALAAVHAEKSGDAPGVVLLALLGGWLGVVVARLTVAARGRIFWYTLARTHPFAVLVVPLLVLWAWALLVEQRLGVTDTSSWAAAEADENLIVLVARSPIKNLEAMSFGVGLGSFAAIAGLVWLVREKPAARPGWLIPVAWVFFGFAAFSMLGKGIGRYLTPVWPGVALLGGMLAAIVLAMLRERARRGGIGGSVSRGVRPAILAAVVVLALGQAWWYGRGREEANAARSPRAIVAEVLALPGVDADDLATFEFRAPAIDYYAGERVEPIGDVDQREDTAGGESMDFQDLRERVVEDGVEIVFARVKQPRDAYWDPRPAIERLREAGFTVEPIETEAEFIIDNGKIEVVALRVTMR